MNFHLVGTINFRDTEGFIRKFDNEFFTSKDLREFTIV